jgi:hypothetical protein
MYTHRVKLTAIFTFLGLVEAVIFSYVAPLFVAMPDSLTIILFPGFWAFMGGTNLNSVMQFLLITIIPFGAVGLIQYGAYALLRKIVPPKFAFVLALCIPLLILSSIVWNQNQKYRTFYHLDDTPEDCLTMSADRREWCFRSMYQRYPIPLVCSKLEDIHKGEAAHCWQLCAQADPNCKPPSQ